jgi:hypothetical protein
VSATCPYSSDVIILDCCRTSLTSAKTSIANYIDTVAHGGMFVVASRSCYRSGTQRAELANPVIQPYGMSSLGEDSTATGCHDIAVEKRTGVLANVTKVSFYRVAPHLTSPANSVYEDATTRPMMSYYERNVTPQHARHWPHGAGGTMERVPNHLVPCSLNTAARPHDSAARRVALPSPGGPGGPHLSLPHLDVALLWLR